MVYPIDVQPAQRLPEGLTLLDFLMSEDTASAAGIVPEAEGHGAGLAQFLQSLDEGQVGGPPQSLESDRAEINAAILADRLFPRERLPNVVSNAALPSSAAHGELLPVVLRRPVEPAPVRRAPGSGWVRVLALMFVVSGVGLFAYAQGMRERERRPAVAQRLDATRAPKVAVPVDVVSTRLNDAATAAALATVAGPARAMAPANGERIKHDPAVPVARILAVVERFIGEGDILAARAMLDDLVGRDDAHGLFAMAETFDPNMLATWHLAASEADVARAKALYRQALQRGNPDAAVRLMALEKP